MDVQDINLIALQNIIDYRVEQIDSNTRFWMVRTKKGYFYDEFISQGYVALAWNIIDKNTRFSNTNIEELKDNIILKYSEIKRPTTVINKCKSFINDISVGDYIVIPNSGSERITLALAGNYYEEANKTYEIEQEVITRIEKGDVIINDISCPYKKRRKITPLITLKSSEIDGKLYKAISNYHGISSLDDYWRNILGEIYNSYCYKNNLNIVYHIKRTEPIGPRKLAELLSKSIDIDCWCSLFEEKDISVQINVASPGPVDFSIISSVIPQISGAIVLIAGITISVISTIKPELIPSFIKNLLSLPAEVNREYVKTKRESLLLKKEQQLNSLEVEEKELDILEKKLCIIEHLKEVGVNPDKLADSAIALAETYGYLQIENVQIRQIPSQLNDTIEDAEDFIEDDISEEERE